MKYITLILVTGLLVSCGGPKPLVDYDRQANFSSYNTYAVYPQIDTGLSQLDDKRLLNALEQAMRAKGFTKSDTPDIYVNIFTSQFQDRNRNSIGIGIGSGGGNVGVGVSGGIPIGSQVVNYLILTLDFIDKSSDDLVWQAKVEEKFNLRANPEQRAKFFKVVLEKAIKQYPPKN